MMLDLFPVGFEECDGADGVELAAYTDAGGEERMWHAFGGARADAVDEGWEDRWRAFHRPVVVAGLWVGPPWEAPPPGGTAVVIDPARAFGTGSHATTRLCLEHLSAIERGSLADLGSGSGVLAIAAAKLGFEPVLAVDSDPVAVEATARNAAANGVTVDVRLGDVAAGPLPSADVTIANITLAAVDAVASRVSSGTFVASGYLEPENPVVPGFRLIQRLAAEGWAADRYERETQ